MRHRRLIAPLHQVRHRRLMVTSRHVLTHTFLAIPRRHRPVGPVTIRQQTTLQKSLRPFHLLQRPQRLPRKQRKKPHRPNPQPRKTHEGHTQIMPPNLPLSQCPVAPLTHAQAANKSLDLLQEILAPLQTATAEVSQPHSWSSCPAESRSPLEARSPTRCVPRNQNPSTRWQTHEPWHSSKPPHHQLRPNHEDEHAPARIEVRQRLNQPRRKVLIQQELHAATVSSFRSRSAANAKQAKMSSSRR